MKRIGVAELKDQLSKHLRAVEAGEEMEVTDRNRAIARIVPVRTSGDVIIRGPARPFTDIRDRTYPAAEWRISSTELLLDERGTR